MGLTDPFAVLFASPDGLFSCQTQAFQITAQGCQAETDAEFLARFALELCQGQVGLPVSSQDVLVSGGVKSPFLAVAMGFGGNVASGAVALQELFDEGDADAKELGDSALDSMVLLIRLDDLLAQISRIRFHASGLSHAGQTYKRKPIQNIRIQPLQLGTCVARRELPLRAVFV